MQFIYVTVFSFRSQREKALELGEDPNSNSIPAVPPLMCQTLISGIESECDRDKELTSRCLKLLMQGRLTVHSALPKVRCCA